MFTTVVCSITYFTWLLISTNLVFVQMNVSLCSAILAFRHGMSCIKFILLHHILIPILIHVGYLSMDHVLENKFYAPCSINKEETWLTLLVFNKETTYFPNSTNVMCILKILYMLQSVFSRCFPEFQGFFLYQILKSSLLLHKL